MLILILCSFVVYTTGAYVLSLLVLFVFVSPFVLAILITSLGEEEAGLCASHTFVCLFCACMFLSFFSSSSIGAGLDHNKHCITLRNGSHLG